MDKAFREIYRNQLEAYRASQLPGLPPSPPRVPERSLAIVTDAIERGVQRADGARPLRPDARLFLTINLHQMVTLPMSRPDSPTTLSPEVEEGLREDVRRIVIAANGMAPSDRQELAASHVLRGTAEILDSLKLKSWRLWERDE